MSHSPGRYVLSIHFYIESGQKMIQFNIQFITKLKMTRETPEVRSDKRKQRIKNKEETKIIEHHGTS